MLGPPLRSLTSVEDFFLTARPSQLLQTSEELLDLDSWGDFSRPSAGCLLPQDDDLPLIAEAQPPSGSLEGPAQPQAGRSTASSSSSSSQAEAAPRAVSPAARSSPAVTSGCVVQSGGAPCPSLPRLPVSLHPVAAPQGMPPAWGPASSSASLQPLSQRHYPPSAVITGAVASLRLVCSAGPDGRMHCFKAPAGAPQRPRNPPQQAPLWTAPKGEPQRASPLGPAPQGSPGPLKRKFGAVDSGVQRQGSEDTQEEAPSGGPPGGRPKRSTAGRRVKLQHDFVYPADTLKRLTAMEAASPQGAEASQGSGITSTRSAADLAEIPRSGSVSSLHSIGTSGGAAAAAAPQGVPSGAQSSPMPARGNRRRPVEEGEIVWAKLNGFPWWPAQVQEPPPEQLRRKPRRGPHLFCVFYETADFEWVPTGQIEPFLAAYTARAKPPGGKYQRDRQAAVAEAWGVAGYEMPQLAAGQCTFPEGLDLDAPLVPE